MRKMQDDSIDTVLTSPFYNTNKKQGKSHTLQNTKSYIGKLSYIRYDTHVDNLTDEEYCDFTEHLFSEFDRILKPNGVVLYNISYGANNTEGMFRAINSIITKTKFTIADVIIWKKKNAVPNNCSRNRLTRICEFVFVFCREDESKSFHCNKRIKSYRESGQPMYENILNFVEAKNNDGVCPYNKATYSTELCEKLLSLYSPPNGVVYDPFIGSGTTAVACEKLGLKCYGSEISANQCKWSKERLNRNRKQIDC